MDTATIIQVYLMIPMIIGRLIEEYQSDKDAAPGIVGLKFLLEDLAPDPEGQNPRYASHNPAMYLVFKSLALKRFPDGKISKRGALSLIHTFLTKEYDEIFPIMEMLDDIPHFWNGCWTDALLDFRHAKEDDYVGTVL